MPGFESRLRYFQPVCPDTLFSYLQNMSRNNSCFIVPWMGVANELMCKESASQAVKIFACLVGGDREKELNS